MSYLEIINMFKQFAAQHPQVKCFGYGSISDIEVPVDPTTGLAVQRDYAYLFINPGNHSMTAHTITYRFNVIVMDLASELQPTGFSAQNSVIKAQSDTLLIINDLLAFIEYNNIFDTELVQNTSITPFKERFNDTVAGMTATLEFVVPNQLNLCDAPGVGTDLALEVWADVPQIVDSNTGGSGGGDRVLNLPVWTPASNPFNKWTGIQYENYNGNYSTFEQIVLTMKFKLQGTGPGIPSPIQLARISQTVTGTTASAQIAPTQVIGWPTTYDPNVEHEVTVIWANYSDGPINPLYINSFTQFRYPQTPTPPTPVQYDLNVLEANAKFYV